MVIDQIIYRSALLQVGLFHCPPEYPSFADTGPINGYLIVFPRTSVTITHSGGRPIIADPNVVMFYNQHQTYRRDQLSERGDLCEWFAFDPQQIVAAVQHFDPQVLERQEHPFRFTHGPSQTNAYIAQRAVVDHLLSTEQPDSLYIEETLLRILAAVVQQAYDARENPRRRSLQHARYNQELAQATEMLLATQFQQPLTLAQLAQSLYTSPYHLCRVFRAATGTTIHAYLNQLRLRTALEYVAQRDTDLATLGLTLGYSSHSHFTAAFHRAFGMPPSHLRQHTSQTLLDQLGKKLIV
jgi:AraC-like DNA-binding protein